jgi:hypothetical protein
MNIDELTHDYMVLRRERERMAAEFKTADERLKDAQAEIEAKLLALCSEHNVDSMRTKNGTVMRSIKSRVHVLDWDAFYDYVLENKAPQLLQKRVHESNFEEFMSERRSDGLPPGVNVAREYSITVRKPSKNDALANDLEAA